MASSLDRVCLDAQRVAGGGVLQASRRHDVASDRLIDALALVGMHAEQARDAFLHIAIDIVD